MSAAEKAFACEDAAVSLMKNRLLIGKKAVAFCWEDSKPRKKKPIWMMLVFKDEKLPFARGALLAVLVKESVFMHGKKIWIIVVAAVCMLAAAAGVIYLAVQNGCPDEPKDLKPILYLYPEKTQEVSVELGRPESLTCTYPLYQNGWKVTAEPDGVLTDTQSGRQFYALYWEGLHSADYASDEGFVVKGVETAAFLEEKLAALGLTDREAQEFIIYWLPVLQENTYNFIRFQTAEEIEANMPLKVTPAPDTVIRVMMQYQALEAYCEVPAQQLETPERSGFTVVEWGGMEMP